MSDDVRRLPDGRPAYRCADPRYRGRYNTEPWETREPIPCGACRYCRAWDAWRAEAREGEG